MTRRITRIYFLLAIVSIFAAAALPGPALARDIDWNAAGAAEVTLFYPGAASWEFLTGPDHSLGGKVMAKGRRGCAHCHLGKGGALDIRADEIASGSLKMRKSHRLFEPEPMPGKKGFLTAVVQAAYDGEALYLRIRWNSQGGGWKSREGAPDRVSVQLNKREPAFRNYGCFISCHNDLDSMPLTPFKKSAGPSYSRDHSANRGARLYAYYARDSWERKKPREVIERKLREGGRIDLLAMEFLNGHIVLEDGWVFDDRVWEDAHDQQPAKGTGGWDGKGYTAVFEIKFGSKDPYDIQLREGDTVTVGLAIHDGGSEKRKHYVSIPFTVGIGAEGAVRAVSLDKK